MALLARTVPAPLVIDVRPGAVQALGPLLADGRISAGGTVAIAVGPGRGDEVASDLHDQLPSATMFAIEGGSLQGAQDLQARLRTDWFDAVVGIGGGRTLDAAKYAASMVGLPFVSVATTLTHDGLASPVASLEDRGRKASYGVHVPIGVVVDIDHVRDAPLDHVQSGVGEVCSNLSALADWELARQVRGEAVDGLAATMARSAASAILQADPHSDGFLGALAESLILSGLAMAVAGSSRPCSGACPEISHALDAFLDAPALHGLQVALGARFATWLRRDHDLLARLDAVMTRHDLPRTPKELGIDDATLARAVVEAPRTRPDRFTILEHLDLRPEAVPDLVSAYTEAAPS